MRKIISLITLLAVIVLVIGLQRERFSLVWRRVRGAPAQQESKNRSEPQPNEDAISPDFLQEAWIVLLPVSRQTPDPEGNLLGVAKADAAMADLQRKARTRADWLIYSQISDYSLAKLLQSNRLGHAAPKLMQHPDECVSAVMDAMRNRVLHARLAVCDRVGVVSVTRHQSPIATLHKTYIATAVL